MPNRQDTAKIERDSGVSSTVRKLDKMRQGMMRVVMSLK